MADKDLIQLDKDITAAIGKDAAIWRKEFSDIQAHVVYMETKAVTYQSMKEMARREGYKSIGDWKKQKPTVVKELLKVLKGPVKSFLAKYYIEVKKAEGKGKVYDVILEGTPSAFAFTVFQASEGGTANIFKNFIKAKKAVPQRPLIFAVNKWSLNNTRRGTDAVPGTEESKYIRSQGAPDTGLKKSQHGPVMPWEHTKSNDSFADFGHIGDSAVGTQRALAGADLLQNYQGNAKKGAALVLSKLQKTFQFILEDSKSYKGDMTKILEVMLEASRFNKDTTTKGEVTSLQDVIDEALGKVKTPEGWVFLEGSDSFFDMIEKTAVAGWAKGLKPNKTTKKLKTSVQYKKRKDSTNTVKGAEHKRKVTHKKGLKYKLPPISTRRQAKAALGAGPAVAPLAMIGLINKELPAAVEGNMGRPRLESITGRLAGSARVTDIITTPQGYPSIGYTYQLSPYQTFETGGDQGSNDYDPRRLIDQSLRSIAAKFAMGRFYTRRVQ
jgi:hypothetical protein